MNGTAQLAQRGLTSLCWSPCWPPLTDWCKAAVVGALIGIGLGINPQVWPWQMMTFVPRTAFWLVLSLLVTFQWIVVTRLMPFIGKPGWLQKAVRPVVVLLVLAPFIGIEDALVSRVVGLLPGISLPDMAIAFSWHFVRWGTVLALPVVLVITWRDRCAPPHAGPLPGAAVPATSEVSQDASPSPATAIIALKAEDHYVRVFTDHSDSLILMRFADAVSRLAPTDGIQVHRSYWVRHSAVKAVVRKRRRFELQLTNGLVVPVSRAYEPEVKSRAPRP